jgi:hypothetical protein
MKTRLWMLINYLTGHPLQENAPLSVTVHNVSPQISHIGKIRHEQVI